MIVIATVLFIQGLLGTFINVAISSLTFIMEYFLN